ncbi:MAG: PTS mannose transporter subunit IIA [Neisseriaceae bacterium]|nr:PTS mannose transporter subunit IIA [Neisseriaceae bacterium]MBP6862341.1 PTS mannose transporter subunit IIA [Neisseriaceae bacterium]
MIGLLIVTHESLGSAFNHLATHFFPALPGNVRILNVEKNDAPETVHAKISHFLEELNFGYGVLILTDIFGATPCNVANKFILNEDTAMLTGLNAPMIVKAIQYASLSTDLQALLQDVKQAAIAGIIDITHKDTW